MLAVHRLIGAMCKRAQLRLASCACISTILLVLVVTSCVGPFAPELGVAIDYSNCDDPEGFWIKTGPWYDRLFKDPWFIQELQQAWKQHLPFLQELPADIRQRAGELSAAQKHNFLVWDILDNYVWPNAVVTGSYQGEIDYLTDWLQRRIDWLDTAIRDL